MSWWFCFFFQAEDGIRDLVRSRGLGDVYKRQAFHWQQLLDDGVVDTGSEIANREGLHHFTVNELLLSLIHI